MLKLKSSKLLTATLLVAVIGLSLQSCKCKKNNVTTEDTAAAAAPIATDSTATTDTTAAASAAGTLDANGNFVRDQGAMKEITLADGTKLNVGANSAEFKLFNNITGTYAVPADGKVGAGDWIILDRVFFASGGDALNADSNAQIANIAKILKAYPNAKVKLGGYTDNTGAAAANKSVSQKRAEKVKSALQTGGIAADRITAEGFGPEFPVCPANDTDECKAQNRRVDVRLTAK